MTGNGNLAGRNAFSARRSITIESLPPEKSSTGRSRSAATSRMMWIASDSSSSRCESVRFRFAESLVGALASVMRFRFLPARSAQPKDMQAALGAVAVGPAALATGARQRGVRVADRGVAAIVQRVVGQAPLADVRPAVVVAPVGERIRLPELVRGVPAELRRVRPRRRLVAADAGDPGVEAAERTNERLDLGDREVEVGLGLPELLPVRRGELLGARAFEHLDLRVVALLDLAPELVRLREEVVRVDREDARLRLDAEQQVEQHALFLLEGAGERDLAGELLDAVADDVLGAHRLDGGRIRKRERACRCRRTH